jgi:hypothetical protein
MPHEGHENHLCYLIDQGLLKDKPDEFKGLVKKGKFMCTGCGRVAKSPDNLCAPQKI